MVHNYIVIALRNWVRNKTYTFISIAGLALGIGCCLIAYAIVKHELTFDSFHPNADRIYRVVEQYEGDYGTQYTGTLPNPMSYTLEEELRSGEATIALHGPLEAEVRTNGESGQTIFSESNIFFSNASFLEYLNFPIVQGGPISALDELNQVFLTENLAVKYFGKQNPLGKLINIDGTELTVAGVLRKAPSNTNTPFDMVISFPTVKNKFERYLSNWGSYWAGFSYVVLRQGENVVDVEAEINAIFKSKVDEETAEKKSYYLQPLSEVHTDTKYGDGSNYSSPKEFVYGTALLALLTLAASVLNFINLATAQAVKRSKEVGIRKTLGSTRANIKWQFLGETFMVVAIGTAIAFTLGQYVLTQINSYITIIYFDATFDRTTLLFAAALIVLVTALAGWYPSGVLAGVSPMVALKSRLSLSDSTGSYTLRKTLVVLQFAVANFLLIISIIVAAQMNFVASKDLGFDKKNVLTIGFPGHLTDQMAVIREQYESLSFVEGATWCFGPPQVGYNWNGSYDIVGTPKDDRMNANVKFVDGNYLDVYKIELLSGAIAVNRYSSDTTMQLMVNEEFVNRAGLNAYEAVGREVSFLGSWKGKIVGVVKDFHAWPLQNGISPVMMLYKPENMQQISLRLSSGQLDSYLPEIEKLFYSLAPNDLFEASLLEESIQEAYVVEDLTYRTSLSFAAVAVIIAVFGMYGLVSYMLARSRKSISIRKVFGAGVSDILGMVSKEYAVLIFLSFFVAVPMGYFLSNKWIQTFEYAIEIGPWYFAGGLAFTIFIAAITIGHKVYRAALSNPIDALRTE